MRVEGQQGRRVHRDRITLQLEQEHVLRTTGEEHLTLPGNTHEVAALPSHSLLDHAAQASGERSSVAGTVVLSKFAELYDEYDRHNCRFRLRQPA